jgi:hypothetical protein
VDPHAEHRNFKSLIGTFPRPRWMIAARSAFFSRSQFAHMSHKTTCALRALSAVAELVPGDRRRFIRVACSMIVLKASRPDRPIPTPNPRRPFPESATGSAAGLAAGQRAMLLIGFGLGRAGFLPGDDVCARVAGCAGRPGRTGRRRRPSPFQSESKPLYS